MPAEPADLRPDGDFLWVNTRYPHDARRLAMLKKYGPELKRLMHHEPSTKYIVTSLVALQLVLGVIASRSGWLAFFALAYACGGFINHTLYLSIHEITHNLAFKKPFYNDVLAMIATIPICIPLAMMFKVYHADHHRYLAWDGVDPDLPTETEAWLFHSFFGKLFFTAFQVVAYAIRPPLVRPKDRPRGQLLNEIIVFGTLGIYGYTYGLWPIAYLLLSALMAGTINPVSGHFLSEHYQIDPSGTQETFSYYGVLNKIAWNVGYHNEHHDFPNVPYTLLPRVRAIAPEYYDNLVQTDSWFLVIWRFLTDSKASLYCRVKRERYAYKRKGALLPEAPPVAETDGDFITS